MVIGAGRSSVSLVLLEVSSCWKGVFPSHQVICHMGLLGFLSNTPGYLPWWNELKETRQKFRKRISTLDWSWIHSPTFAYLCRKTGKQSTQSTETDLYAVLQKANSLRQWHYAVEYWLPSKFRGFTTAFTTKEKAQKQNKNNLEKIENQYVDCIEKCILNIERVRESLHMH